MSGGEGRGGERGIFVDVFRDAFSLVHQIEHLKRQDTSAQLREARDHLSTSQEEHRRTQAELSEVKKKEEKLKDQLAKVEEQWKRKLEQVQLSPVVFLSPF